MIKERALNIRDRDRSLAIIANRLGSLLTDDLLSFTRLGQSTSFTRRREETNTNTKKAETGKDKFPVEGQILVRRTLLQQMKAANKRTATREQFLPLLTPLAGYREKKIKLLSIKSTRALFFLLTPATEPFILRALGLLHWASLLLEPVDEHEAEPSEHTERRIKQRKKEGKHRMECGKRAYRSLLWIFPLAIATMFSAQTWICLPTSYYTHSPLLEVYETDYPLTALATRLQAKQLKKQALKDAHLVHSPSGKVPESTQLQSIKEEHYKLSTRTLRRNACALARAVTSGVSSADEASKGRRLKIHSCTEPLTRQVDRQQAQLDLLIYDASFFHMSGSLIFVSELKPLPFTP
ncbi:hypothetical protein VNO77_18125 [Canavalia gladiata]|uniref:Uncharacterized protein n=1 Tax=Canavalia gladiata TaxID=3824 RepID=A0AAN9LK88_CANGL